jgi:DNA-binding MarR family transcriptional regulator
VYEAVLETPSLTSAELAERHNLDRHMLARRLPELREAGLLRDNRDDSRFMRRCRVSGTRAVVWVLAR